MQPFDKNNPKSKYQINVSIQKLHTPREDSLKQLKQNR